MAEKLTELRQQSVEEIPRTLALTSRHCQPGFWEDGKKVKIQLKNDRMENEEYHYHMYIICQDCIPKSEGPNVNF